jgi:hypothetical protein
MDIYDNESATVIKELWPGRTTGANIYNTYNKIDSDVECEEDNCIGERKWEED